VATKGLIHSEDVGFAAESTDALDAADEAGDFSGFDALQFFPRRPFGQEAGDFFVNGLLDFRQIAAGFGRGHDAELAADFPIVNVSRDVGGDLLVINQPFVEATRLARNQDVGYEIEIDLVGLAIGGDVPDFVEAGLGDAIGGALAAGASDVGNPIVILDYG